MVLVSIASVIFMISSSKVDFYIGLAKSGLKTLIFKLIIIIKIFAIIFIKIFFKIFIEILFIFFLIIIKCKSTIILLKSAFIISIVFISITPSFIESASLPEAPSASSLEAAPSAASASLLFFAEMAVIWRGLFCEHS
jgi:hypothetical protein